MAAISPAPVAYLCREEGLVQESYLDTSDPPVWTFAIGLTAASGVNVLQYKNNPQPIDVCLKISIEVLCAKYLPAVHEAFAGHQLTEPQLAAALGFHWETGAIKKAQWVKDFKAGKLLNAKHDLTNNYIQGGRLQKRRNREADLFFKGKYPDDMRCPIRKVSKPSYRPCNPISMDVTPILHSILGGQ